MTVCDRQTTTGAERRRTSRQRHAQVRPWTVTDSMPTCTGSMWQIGSGTSLVLQCTDVSTTKRRMQYLVDCCVPVSDIASRQRLRSARRCLLTVPRHRRSTFGRWTFSVAGPAVLNLLPDQLRDSDCTESAFRKSLKIFFFNQY